MTRVQTRKPKDKTLSESFVLQDIGFDSDDFVESKNVGTTGSELKTVGTTDSELKNVGATDSESKNAGTTGSELKTVGTTDSELKTVGTTDSELKNVGATDSESKTVGTTGLELKAVGTTGSELKAVGTKDSELKTGDNKERISVREKINRLEQELDGLKRKNKLSKNAQRIITAIKNESLIQKTTTPTIGYKKLTSRDTNGYNVHPNYFRKALIELESKAIIKRTEVSYSGQVKTHKWQIID